MKLPRIFCYFSLSFPIFQMNVDHIQLLRKLLKQFTICSFFGSLHKQHAFPLLCYYIYIFVFSSILSMYRSFYFPGQFFFVYCYHRTFFYFIHNCSTTLYSLSHLFETLNFFFLNKTVSEKCKNETKCFYFHINRCKCSKNFSKKEWFKITFSFGKFTILFKKFFFCSSISYSDSNWECDTL